MYGFSGERKERKMIKAMVPLKYRDYCAHHYINYQKCARTRPMIDFFNQCGGEKHEWEHCQYEDFIMRQKEYERERRLLQREKAQEAKRKLIDERKELLKQQRAAH